MDYEYLQQNFGDIRKEQLNKNQISFDYQMFWVNNLDKFFEQILNDYKNGNKCSEIKIDKKFIQLTFEQFKSLGYKTTYQDGTIFIYFY